MTYKLNPEVRKITSPILLSFCGGSESKSFPNGTALADAEFDKNYCVDSISANGGKIVVTVRENERVNAISWIGEEAVEPSFF